MKRVLQIVCLMLTLIVSAQTFNEVQYVEIYNLDGTTTLYDIHQPAKSISQEDGLISENKCIRWLFISEFYGYKAIETENTYFIEKANHYASLFRKYNCHNDEYLRFQMVRDRWYIQP